MAVVTGGGRGIGRAIAECLSGAGAEVHVFESGAGAGLPFPVHAVDVRRNGEIAAGLAAIAHPVTLLVNNAGITRDRTLQKMSDAEWQEVLDVNLTGAFNMIRAVAPGMVGGGFGRIVNVTSINGLRGKFGQANYAAAKAGLIGLTKTAARELGPKGITVNAVAPGMVLTDMTLAAPEAVRDRALAESLLQRLAEPVDVARAVLFLLSDSARMITGTVLRVDAGQNT
ncbi:MAG: SDR family oxidoreductase [Gammaproteobacteria bacterium]|nr:SDR family oxidoreductase [Gammaproteobacteria bacterium]